MVPLPTFRNANREPTIVSTAVVQMVLVRPIFFVRGSISRMPGPMGDSAIIWNFAWMAATLP